MNQRGDNNECCFKLIVLGRRLIFYCTGQFKMSMNKRVQDERGKMYTLLLLYRLTIIYYTNKGSLIKTTNAGD